MRDWAQLRIQDQRFGQNAIVLPIHCVIASIDSAHDMESGRPEEASSRPTPTGHGFAHHLCQDAARRKRGQ